MKITHELSVCTDCLMLIANGECGDEAETARVADAQVTQWGTDATNMVVGSEDLGFSWSACEGCGSTAGGDRHAAAILGN